MAKRMAQVDEIGYLKKENNIAILQTERWDEILDNMRLVGTELGLSQEFINIFVRAMHQESIDRQERIFKN